MTVSASSSAGFIAPVCISPRSTQNRNAQSSKALREDAEFYIDIVPQPDIMSCAVLIGCVMC